LEQRYFLQPERRIFHQEQGVQAIGSKSVIESKAPIESQNPTLSMRAVLEDG
jgi:hypothetical protein